MSNPSLGGEPPTLMEKFFVVSSLFFSVRDTRKRDKDQHDDAEVIDDNELDS